jgi:hypothetical protein
MKWFGFRLANEMRKVAAGNVLVGKSCGGPQFGAEGLVRQPAYLKRIAANSETLRPEFCSC